MGRGRRRIGTEPVERRLVRGVLGDRPVERLQVGSRRGQTLLDIVRSGHGGQGVQPGPGLGQADVEAVLDPGAGPHVLLGRVEFVVARRVDRRHGGGRVLGRATGRARCPVLEVGGQPAGQSRPPGRAQGRDPLLGTGQLTLGRLLVVDEGRHLPGHRGAVPHGGRVAFEQFDPGHGRRTFRRPGHPVHRGGFGGHQPAGEAVPLHHGLGQGGGPFGQTPLVTLQRVAPVSELDEPAVGRLQRGRPGGEGGGQVVGGRRRLEGRPVGPVDPGGVHGGPEVQPVGVQDGQPLGRGTPGLDGGGQGGDDDRPFEREGDLGVGRHFGRVGAHLGHVLLPLLPALDGRLDRDPSGARLLVAVGRRIPFGHHGGEHGRHPVAELGQAGHLHLGTVHRDAVPFGTVAVPRRLLDAFPHGTVLSGSVVRNGAFRVRGPGEERRHVGADAVLGDPAPGSERFVGVASVGRQLTERLGRPDVDVDREQLGQQVGPLLGPGLQDLLEPALRDQDDLLELGLVEADQVGEALGHVALAGQDGTFHPGLGQDDLRRVVHQAGAAAGTRPGLGGGAGEDPVAPLGLELEGHLGAGGGVRVLAADVAVDAEAREVVVEGVDDGVEDGRLAGTGRSGDREDPVTAQAGEVDGERTGIGPEGLQPQGQGPHAGALRCASPSAASTRRRSESDGARSRTSSRNSRTTDSSVRSSTGGPSDPKSTTAPVRGSS